MPPAQTRPDHKPRPCRHAHRFEALCDCVEERELLTDALLDTALARLADCDDYFLFVEAYRACLLPLSRDATVAAHAAAPPHPRLVGVGKGGHRHGAYPPSGCLPSEALPPLVAPLAYLFPEPAGMFRCMRALYCRCAAAFPHLSLVMAQRCHAPDCTHHSKPAT